MNQNRSASRTAKINGFKSLKEMANEVGLHPKSLPRIYRTDPDRFLELIKEAKQARGMK